MWEWEKRTACGILQTRQLPGKLLTHVPSENAFVCGVDVVLLKASDGNVRVVCLIISFSGRSITCELPS